MDIRSILRSCLLAVMVFLLVGLNAHVHGWRPQGRFGKRMDGSGLTEETAIRQMIEQMEESSLLSDPGLPVFRYGDIYCVRKGADALYRCLEYNSGKSDVLLE